MQTGIHHLTREEYDVLPAVNASLLKACDRSMSHGKAYMDGNRKDSPSMAFGRAYHLFILEPDAFAKTYTVLPKMRRAGKAWDEAVESAGGDPDRIIFADDVAEFEAMRAAILAESRRRRLTTERGLYEVSVVWTDEEAELLCKARMDKVIESLSVAVDLKTTTDARPHAFFRDAATYGYDLQAAFYMDGLHAVTGTEYDFAFLAQESDAPYASRLFTATWGGDMHQIGRAKYRPLLQSVKRAKETNVWPGYGDEPVEVVIPQWAVPDSIKQGAM